MPTIQGTGRILDAPAHGITSLLSYDWLMPDGFGKFTVWVWSTSGGSLTIFNIPDAEPVSHRLQGPTNAIAASTLTVVAVNYKWRRGVVVFTPTAPGASWIEFDSSR